MLSRKEKDLQKNIIIIIIIFRYFYFLLIQE